MHNLINRGSCNAELTWFILNEIFFSSFDQDLKTTFVKRIAVCTCWSCHVSYLESWSTHFQNISVLVTTKERECFTSTENSTLPEIKTHIEELISSSSDSDVREVLAWDNMDRVQSFIQENFKTISTWLQWLLSWIDRICSWPFSASKGDSDDD